MNDIKSAVSEKSEPIPRLGEIGLSNFAPYLMNRIMGRYNADLRQEMTGLGLTTPKMRALAVLSVIDALPITELAVYAVVEQSTLSRSLEQLASDGLVRRDPDPTDSRVTRISITEAGRAALDQLWPSMVRVYEQMFKDIPAEERQAFVTTLQKMLNNVRKHDF
ncbi:MarR family transcriptional regulator [Hoeflea sp. YIM 152468]|uniref:MarR family winged helix-turn-helix transcriptional regulator n=1 Tax=Hoeflea sp. YIM 152468 TaxID=3031759 RepID=UPI0023DC9D6F|nr:MarR family transcriptional regulator [Hoeflea sp. YIM 152468]MDF1609468.1 MarR family transcriptional regulator [Hoeflea sp. YIM 152468]